jgi:outer membrane protein
MKRTIALLVLALLLVSTQVMAAGIKIGYLDLQKALSLCQAGKDAKVKMKEAAQKYNAPLAARQKEIQNLRAELQKQALVLNQNARAAKEQDYRTKMEEYQRFTKDIQDEMQQRESSYIRKIIGGLEDVAQDIGKKEGYTLILEHGQNMIIYADKKIDITGEVIKAYNKVYQKEKAQQDKGE